MKLSKLSKEKRKHLIGVVVGTIAVLSALGFFLIKGSYEKLSQLDQKKTETQQKLEQMQSTVSRSKSVETVYNETLKILADKETGMASGDLYSWMHGTLRKFQRSYKVEIPQLSPIGTPTDVNLLANFPYKQAVLGVSGTAHYHELGRFVADFENQFPLMRIVNLSLDLNPSPTASDHDKLAFRMDIVTLVKPGQL